MKVDRSKIRKLQSDVPLESQELIDCIKSAAVGRDLHKVLGSMKHWPVGKCELLHWVDVLDILDDVLAENAKRTSFWSLRSDNDKAETRGLLLAVLNFTALLVEHSYSRHLYSSVEHLIALMGSSDLDVVLSVLNLFYVFSKRSTFIQKLPVNLKAPLITNLLAIANGYGGRANHLDIASCCKLHITERVRLAIDACENVVFTIPAEFFPPERGLVSIQIENVKHAVNQTSTSKPGALMDEMIRHYGLEPLLQNPFQIAAEKSAQTLLYELFNRIRLAFYFGQRNTRILCIEARLQALSILMYSNLASEQTHILLYPGIIKEFSECLFLENTTDLIDAKSGVLKCLTSVIHLERHVNHAEIVEIMQIASYHGFLPDLVRTCVRQLTSKDENAPVRFPHSFITALFSFLYHLASYDGGSEALISSGTIKTLLEVVGHHDSSDANVMFVTRAVRVLDLITNVEMAAFQQANGVSIFIDRLKYESDQCRITNPFEIRLLRSAEEPTLQSPAPQQKPARTCYHQRGALMKSILNFIKRSINDHSVADTVRHLMEGSLPDSLKHILSNCDYYGSSLFLLTAEIVSQYIFAEPSQMSYLQEIGLCDVLLYSLIKLEIPPTREVLASLPGFLGSLCLNQAGLDTFLRYKPFDRLFKVLLSPNYLSAMRRRRATNAVSQAAADPAMSMVIPSASSHSTAFVLGQAMDELMRHQPSLKESAMESLVGLLDQLIQIGSESSRVLREDSADCPPLFEYINNIARFIEAVLSSNVNSAEHMSEFIRLRGHELLLRVCFLPQIPLNHTGPPIALALSGLLRMIIQNLRNDLLIRTLFVSVDPVLSDIQKILKDRLVTHLTPCGQRIDRALAYLNTFTHILLAMLKSSSTEARSITYGLLTIEIGLDFLRRLAEIYGELVVEELVFHSMIFTPTVQSFDVQPYVRKWFETRVWDEIKCERELTDRSYLPGQVVNYTVPIYNHIVRTLRSLAELFAVVNRISATPAAIAQRNRIVFTNGAPHNVLKIINEHLLRNGFAKRENDLERIYCIAHFITFAQSILFDERRRPYHLSLCHFLTFQAETAFFDAMWWLASRIKEAPLVDCLVPSNRPPSPTTTTTNQQQLDAMISEKDVFGHGLALIFCLLDHNVTAKSPYNLTSGEPPFSDVVFTLRMESAANSLVSLVWNNGQTTGPKLNEQLLQIISSIATDREFFGRSIKRPRNIESADLEALELSPNDPGAQIRNQYFQKANNNNDSLVQVPVPQIEPPLTQISQLQIYLMNEAVQGQFLNLVENLTRGLLAALDATPDSVHKIREIVSLVAVQHNSAQWIEHFLTQLADRIIEQIKQLPNLDSKTAATASLVLANTLLQERPAHTASVFAKTSVFNHAIELINNDESNELFRYLANDNSRYLATLTLFIDLYLCGIRDLQRIVPLHRRCLDQCYCVWKSYDERHGRWLSYNVRQNAMITEAFVQGRSQLRISPNRRHFVVHFNALIQLSDDQRKTRSMALWLIPHTNSELDNKIRLPYGLANLRSAPKLPFFLRSLFGAPYKQPEPFRIADHEPPLEPSQQPILQSILRILSAQTQLDSDTVHSSLRIILRLTQTPQNVSHFLNDLNGLEVLASIPSSYSFLGIMSLMIMIIKHVIDTDHNLSYSMEKFIRYTMNSQNGRNPSVNSSGATREIYALMRTLTPLICRNPTVSMETILRTLKVTEPSMSDIEDISNGYGTIMVGLRRNETGVHFKACPQTQRVINFLLDLVHRAPQTAVLSKSAILRILSELVRSYSGLGNLVMSHGTFAEIVDRYVDSDDETAPYARLLVTTIASSTNSVLGQKQLIAQIQFSLRKCVDQIVGAEASLESLAKYQAIAGLASLVVHACSSSQRASAAGHVQFLNALKESGLIEDLVGVLTKVPLNCANENVIQTVHCVVRTIDNVTKPFYQAKNGAVATRNQPEQQQQPEVEPPTAAEEANPSAYVRIEHDEAGAAHLAIGVDSLTVNENDEELAPADDDDGDDDEEETLGEDAADVEDDTEASVDDDDDDDETAPESTVARYSDCDEEHDEEDEVELRNPEVLQAEDDDEEEEYSSDSDVEMHDALDDDVEMEEEEDANPDEEGQADSRPEDDVLGFLDEIDDDYEGDEIDMDEDDGFAGTGAPAVDGDEDEVLDDEDDEEDEEEEDEDEEEPVEEHIHFQLDIPPRIGHSGWLLGGGDDDETLGGTGPNGIYDLYSRYSENGAAMNSWITSAAHAACLAALTTEQSSAQNVGQLHLLVTNNSLVNSAANAVAAAATAGSTIPYGANLVTSLMTTNSIPQNANPSVIASAAASAAAAAITYSSSLPLIHPILLRRPAEFENFVQSTGGRRSQLIRPNRPNDAFFTASRAAAQAVSNSIGFNRPFPAAHPRFLAVGEMIHSAAGGNQQRFTATARMPGGRNDQHPRADDGITRNPVSAILNDLGLNNIPRTAEPAQMSFPTHASSTAAAAADVLLAPMVRWIEECSIVDGSAFHLSTILLRQELIIKLYAEVESTFDKKLSEYSTSTRQLSAESEPRAAPETLYEDEETQAGQEGHEDDEDIITQDEDEEMVVEEVHHQQDDVEMSEEQPATTLTQQVESAETGETQPPPQNTTEETLAVSSAANDEGPVEYFDVTIEGHTYTVPSWVDRSFLQELPHNIRLEVIQQQTRIARTRERQQQAATAATVADDESAAMPEISEEVLTSMGISIDFLDELPQNIRAEVLEGLRVQEANRIRSEEVRIEDLATNADPTQFLRSLNPQLRNQLLSELEESQLAALPEDLASEANALRVQSFRNLAVRAGGGGHRRTFLRGLRSRGGAGILLNPHRVENLEMFRWALEDEDFNQLGPFDMAPRVFRGLGLARRGARLGAGGMVHVGHGSGAPLRNHHNHNQLQIPLENVPNVELSDESISILLVNLFLGDNRSHNSRIQRVIRNIMTNPPQMCQLIRSLCMILARCTGQIEIVLGHAKIPEGELILVEPCWLKLTRPGPFGKRVPSFSMYKQLTKPPLPYPTYICLDEHASSEVCRHALEIITYLINIAHDKFVMLKLDQELMKSGDIFWRDVICAELKFAENEMDIPRIYGTPGYEDQNTDTTVFAHLISLVHHPIIRYNLSLLDTLFGILGQLSYQLDKYIVVASGTNNGKCFRPKPANSAASGQQDLPRYEGIVFEEQIEAIVDVLVDQNPVFQYGSIKGNTLSNLTDVLTSFTHFNKATHDRILDLTLKGVTTIGLDLEKEIRLLYEESSVFEMFDSNDQADAEEVDDETQPQQQPPETASSSKLLNVPAMDPFVIKHSTQQFFLCVLRVVIDLKRSDIVDLNDPPTYLSSSLDLGELWRALDDCLLQLQSLSDPQTVLLLQPSVEAFFLVHAPVSQLTGRRRRLPDARTGREQRALNLAHLTTATSASANEPAAADEQQPAPQQPELNTPTAQSSLPSGLNVTYSEMAIRERLNPTADETQRNRNLFLSFANSHSKVLNHILRQSQGSLIDGPFSVLCEYTHILDFDVKRKYFQEELNQLRSNNLREDVSVNVRRDHLFEDSYRELNRRSADDWKRRFYISFEGEEGQDAGGLLREWYCVISKEIFNPNYALFMINPSDRVTYMPNPASHANSNHLSYFKFVGRVIAKAIFDSKHLDCYFTRFFYKHILGVSVDYSDMESVDHDFYKNLCLILKTDASAYELNFSTDVQEFGATKTVDLKENGRNIAVTNENKQEYVRLLCHEKMIGSIRSQLLAFLDGFYSIIPKRLISIFDEHELELLISGLPDIDVEDLRQNTDYHKYRANSLQIQWLWRALRSFEKDDLAKFVQFVTGTSKVPLGGFAHLEGMNGPQKMQIHRDERSSDRLPCAHTCFNQLDLPVYETYEKLRQRLLTAIHECQIGFGLA